MAKLKEFYPDPEYGDNALDYDASEDTAPYEYETDAFDHFPDDSAHADFPDDDQTKVRIDPAVNRPQVKKTARRR